MGCQATICPNCKKSTKACNLRKAKDNKTTCCVSCVTSFNTKISTK